MVDDREVAGPQPLDEVLRPPAEAGGPGDLGHGSLLGRDRRQELLATEHPLELRAALVGRELLDPRVGRIAGNLLDPEVRARRRSRSAAGA